MVYEEAQQRAQPIARTAKLVLVSFEAVCPAINLPVSG